MIDIGKLCCESISTGDPLRYGKNACYDSHGNAPHKIINNARDRKPIVVWNITKTCNFNCIHCYTDSENKKYVNELTTVEGKELIDSLADFQIPSLLFSGGEPLMRKDLFSLMEYAAKKGLRPVVSTNGSLIDKDTAKKIKDSGVVYVGISLDGMEHINDSFRGFKGAFKKTMQGFDALRSVDQRVGLRLTLTKTNYTDLDRIFDFIEKEQINRACFYHLVYSGRGEGITSDDLTYIESKNALDIIVKRTMDFYKRNLHINILTVDNHVDGVYIYRKMLAIDPGRAKEIYKLLEWNGGGAHSTGVGIGNVDHIGNVHPDQFWQDYTFGNVRDRRFGDIWTDENDDLMKGLKNKADYIKGRCRICKYTNLCTGAMRVRAYRVFNDPWAPDPQCYLTDDEIGITPDDIEELKERGEYFPLPG